MIMVAMTRMMERRLRPNTKVEHNYGKYKKEGGEAAAKPSRSSGLDGSDGN